MADERIELEPEGVERTMKPMLAACLQEAIHLALIDSATPEPDPDADTLEGRAGLWTDAERGAMELDIYAIPGAALAGMDPLALCQNVAVRLLGKGGWTLPTPNGAMYTGNATTTDIFEASFERPDRDHTAEVAFDLRKTIDEATQDTSVEEGEG